MRVSAREGNMVGRTSKAMSLLAALGFGLAVLAAPVAALADDLELKTESFQDVVKTGPDGKQTVVRKAITKAAPGDEITYVISYRNVSSRPVDNAHVDDAVPKGLVYKAGSAVGPAGVHVQFSADGGGSYADYDSLKVTMPDGQVRMARGEDVTNIRWTLTSPLAPAAKGSVSFKALLP